MTFFLGHPVHSLARGVDESYIVTLLHSLRGERIDERFTDDNEFWRYTGKIGNPYGDPLYEVLLQIRKNKQIQNKDKYKIGKECIDPLRGTIALYHQSSDHILQALQLPK